MKIELLNNIFEIQNNKQDVDMLFSNINSILEDEQYTFDCMEIDGNPVYNDHYDYIIANLDEICEIKVVIIRTAELIKNILTSAVQYTQAALPEVSKLSDEFYRGAEQGTWSKLQQLIEGIEWINSGTAVIENGHKCFDGSYEYIKAATEMSGKLSELSVAVKHLDTVLIGDLLHYEIIPELETINEIANDLLSREVE